MYTSFYIDSAVRIQIAQVRPIDVWVGRVCVEEIASVVEQPHFVAKLEHLKLQLHLLMAPAPLAMYVEIFYNYILI